MSGDLTQLYSDLRANPDPGENLESDAAFAALATASLGKPEQQYGDTIVPAEDPEWKDIQAEALALVERSRDLRVLTTLAVARLNMANFRGFADVLALTRDLLDTHWEVVHPQLDPEDDNDPMMRANAVLGLADPRVVRRVRELPLAASARAGRVSWRDIALATGVIEPEEGVEKPQESTIVAAFREADPAALADLTDALATAIQSLSKIGSIFDDRAGYGTGPDLSRLEKLLGDVLKMVEHYTPSEGEAPGEAEGGSTGGGGELRGGGVSAGSITSVQTRTDALRLLDLVLAYYERAEPSSPLPLLIQRAKRLADMSFLEIMQDIAPDGMPQAQVVTGKSLGD